MERRKRKSVPSCEWKARRRREGKEDIFPKGSGPRLAEDDVVFLHVCRWIACMFRSFSVCTGMAWGDLAGSVRCQSGLLAPGFLLAGAFFAFSWQHKLRGLSICLKVMVHFALGASSHG